MVHLPFRIIFFTLLVIIVDQISKVVAQNAGMVTLNPGVALSFLSSAPNWFWIGATGAVVVIGGWKGRAAFLRQPVLAGVLLGGALSNLLDRFLYGAVRDWISIPGLGIRNNIADWAIILALTVMIIEEWRSVQV